MLRELISTKINEIFAEYQEANNIISGDIDPLDALQLELIERGLEQLVEKVCAKQPKEIPASFYIYTDSEGIAHSVTYEHIDTDKFFYEISKRIAFDDLTYEEITDIYWRGMRIEYAGWQPCMTFEYKDLNGKTVWVGQFEDWDH
jgi:hypothetical protein